MTNRREPIKAIGIAAARAVRAALGYAHPTEIELEVLAYMRGVTVRPAGVTGARANLLRVGERAIVGVAAGLSPTERRWAIAHELGHFEAHPAVSFLDLCTNDDMVPRYQASGREPEANAFAAELLMPEDLFRPRCDVARVSWHPVEELARDFQVSVMAAGLRFVEYTDDRAAIVCPRGGAVEWTIASKTFGSRPKRGARVTEWSEAHAFFAGKEVSAGPETVSASAWLEDGEDDEELVEHVFPLKNAGVALSLLWWRP